MSGLWGFYMCLLEGLGCRKLQERSLQPWQALFRYLSLGETDLCNRWASTFSCLFPAVGEVRFAVCGISAASMLLGSICKPTSGSLPWWWSGASRVATAVPLCMTSLSHSSALGKSGALNLILLSFEALQTIYVSSSGCKCFPCLPHTLWLG